MSIEPIARNEPHEDKGKKPATSKAASPDLKGELVMDEHQITVEEIYARYQTSPQKGLSLEEAASRLARDGPNILTPPKGKSELRIFVEQFISWFACLLWVGGILSFIGYAADPSDISNLYVGIVLIACVVISGIFSYIQERKASNEMKKFSNLLPSEAMVRRGGNVFKTPAAALVLGDVVCIVAGDKVPADIRIIKCHEFKVDNSSITGEAEAQPRSLVATHPQAIEAENLAFSGSLAKEGTAEGVVVRTGDNTCIGRIAGLVKETKKQESTIAKEINAFIFIISSVAITLGIGFFVARCVIDKTVTIATVVFMISVVVANIPEGLLPTVTVALALTAKRMARKKVLVKDLECVETLGATTVICSDKTGTLTQNRMTVSHAWYDGQMVDCLPDAAGARFDPAAPTFQMLQRVATLCNRAELNQEDIAAGKHLFDVRTTGDASESALVKFCQKLRDVREYRSLYPEVFGVPFNSVNKFQLSVHTQPAGDGPRLLVVMKGAPERIIARCSHIAMAGADVQPLTDEARAAFQTAYDEMGGQGERVLGFAYLLLDAGKYPATFEFKENPREGDAQSTFNFPAENLVFAGLFSLIDPPRESVPLAVTKCGTSGVKVIMVTGDHPLTAKAIARKIGLITEDTVEDIAKRENVPVSSVDPKRAKAIVVTGVQLPSLTEQQWDEILAHPQIVFARTSPQQKYIIVENNQRRGEVVAVTGDGVNDSPALKKANIGVAMGISGSDVSKDAAKMILLDDNFASIVAGIEEGRLIYDNLKKSIAYTLSSNVSECAPFLAFLLFGVPLPISTILILCIDLGADMLSAISLAYELPEADLMMRPPRNMKTDSLLTLRMVSFSYPQMGVLASLTGFFLYIIYMHHFGFAGHDLTGLWKVWTDEGVIMNGRGFAQRFNVLSAAQTAYFAGVMMGKLAILISCKTRKLSIFRQSWRNNVLNVAIVLQILVTLLIVYVPPFHIIFGSRSIKWFFFGCFPWFAFMVLYDEVRKWLMRRSPGGWIERNTYW